MVIYRCIGLVAAVAAAGQAGTLFQDNFNTPGTRLNLAAWTTETGPSSFLGRTQLADWVTPGGVGQFVAGADGAQLALHTFNPTGFSLYGTHGKTLMSFLPTANTAIVLTTRLQLTSLQPGIVYGMYFYGCVPAACATQHDEIDIELVTNLLQPGGSPLMVQLNRYANEPLGAGNGVLVNLPAGFSPLAPHDWTIRWSLTRVDYLVDGVLLFAATTHVPQGSMQVNEIAWAPASDWSTAFSSLLQPVSSAAQVQSFVAFLRSVSVISSSTTPSNVGIFRSGFLWLEDLDGNRQFNALDRVFAFGGIPGDIPITGDWNGSGTSKVGVYRSSNGLFILDYDGDGQLTAVDKVYTFGVGTEPGDIPVVGDWNGDGRTKIGLFRQGFFWILDNNGNGTFDAGDQAFAYGGIPGDVPIVGDWNGTGASKVGVFRAGFLWILDTNNNHAIDGGDQIFPFGGIAGDVPVVGDWNGDGRTKVGVFRLGFFWVLDANGNFQFDGTGPGQDLAFAFGGISGDKPVVGKW